MTLQTRVTIAEAESGLARLIDQVRQGEDVVLVENDVEVARLVIAPSEPLLAKQRWREPGLFAGMIKEIDPDWWKPDDELADLFEGSESFDNEVLGVPKPLR